MPDTILSASPDTLARPVQSQSRLPPGTFELGLVLAGAVSAGAYTAGALDFLIEAMDEWEAAKAAGQPVPPHQVRLTAISGASAGAMCGAILAAALPRRFPPVSLKAPAPGGTGNPLFDTWVDGPDIRDFLDTSDLESGTLQSVLNTERLGHLVDAALNARGKPEADRKWVLDPLRLRLSVANLRGIPYGVDLAGAQAQVQGLLVHADHMAFSLVRNALPAEGDVVLRPPAVASEAGWKTLGQAALASGAFPVALRARALERALGALRVRKVIVPGDGVPGSPWEVPRAIDFNPRWPANEPDPGQFLCVDGGTMNNEPLELCRQAMLANPVQRMTRLGAEADRALLMIDPFPDPVRLGPAAETASLPQVLAALISAWKMQCRLSAVDVSLALSDDAYSRYLLAPQRNDNRGGEGGPLAAGGLGAFLGFFHRDFRSHDYLLGRRNCQQLLRLHFALPTENDLFSLWPPGLKDSWASDAEQRQDLAERWRGKSHLPIIPLVGSAAVPQPLPDWPAGRLRPESLGEPIEARLDKVFQVLLAQLQLGWLPHQGARSIWWWERRRLRDAAVEAIQKTLKAKSL
ncbi:MAG: patatin-like phospholipase family protein [Acetobacteraceae bacterium]